MPGMSAFHSTKNLEEKIDRLSNKIDNNESNNPRKHYESDPCCI